MWVKAAGSGVGRAGRWHPVFRKGILLPCKQCPRSSGGSPESHSVPQGRGPPQGHEEEERRPRVGTGAGAASSVGTATPLGPSPRELRPALVLPADQRGRRLLALPLRRQPRTFPRGETPGPPETPRSRVRWGAGAGPAPPGAVSSNLPLGFPLSRAELCEGSRGGSFPPLPASGAAPRSQPLVSRGPSAAPCLCASLFL